MNTSPAPIPAPAFDPAAAKPVAPYLHESTRRTVARHQLDGEAVHLFSATGVYIATVKKGEAEQLAAAAAAAAQKSDAATLAAAKAAHDEALKRNAPKPAGR